MATYKHAILGVKSANMYLPHPAGCEGEGNIGLPAKADFFENYFKAFLKETKNKNKKIVIKK